MQQRLIAAQNLIGLMVRIFDERNHLFITSLFRTSSARLVHQNLQREFDGMRAQEFH